MKQSKKEKNQWNIQLQLIFHGKLNNLKYKPFFKFFINIIKKHTQ